MTITNHHQSQKESSKHDNIGLTTKSRNRRRTDMLRFAYPGRAVSVSTRYVTNPPFTPGIRDCSICGHQRPSVSVSVGTVSIKTLHFSESHQPGVLRKGGVPVSGTPHPAAAYRLSRGRPQSRMCRHTVEPPPGIWRIPGTLSAEPFAQATTPLSPCDACTGTEHQNQGECAGGLACLFPCIDMAGPHELEVELITLFTVWGVAYGLPF